MRTNTEFQSDPLDNFDRFVVSRIVCAFLIAVLELLAKNGRQSEPDGYSRTAFNKIFAQILHLSAIHNTRILIQADPTFAS